MRKPKGEIQTVELDNASGHLMEMSSDLPYDFSFGEIRGGCTMTREEHHKHIRRILAIPQRP